MKKYIVIIGLNDKDSKKQEISTLDAFKILQNIFVEVTGGATISECKGVYTHNDGSTVCENSLRCEIYNSDKESVERACGMAKIALNQESVAIETCEVHSFFF